MIEVATLVDRCRRGDALAWEALVRRCQGRVFGVAFQYMHDAEEARDVAQDVFVRVYERLDGFRGDDSFVAWIVCMTRNACIDRLRKRSARPPASDLPVEAGLDIASTAPGPEEAAAAGDRARLLHRALGQMSDSSREMIVLKDIQGLKLAEIAGLLDLPIGTVKSRSSRARIELASRIRCLDPCFGPPNGRG